MKNWPDHPIIYEINTWVWLQELSRKYKRSITLSTVPQKEWDVLFSLGVDAVWFMGVWERSPKGIQIALNNQGLLSEFKRVLPDFTPEDVVGSPYCVRRYEVDQHLGGAEGLAVAREILWKNGLRLILDFVPNHLAPDHPWTTKHPEFFIRGNEEDLQRDPASFLKIDGNIFACGRDPYFPAWPDVLQLNAFNGGLRQAIIDTISRIAEQCDGIRCDMAMLLLNTIFERTWGSRAGGKPVADYWTTVIPAVKKRQPEFRFIAEAYWDLEWELQQQGFDYCYDKRLYDRMEHNHPENVRLHLLAEHSYQEKLVRFIENHDEPRAAAVFSSEKARAAAVVTLTLTGAKLLHEGQFEGMKVRLPVFLGRRPAEPADNSLSTFYKNLMKAVNREVFRNGEWRLCERSGWADNQSYFNLLTWCWSNAKERFLIVVNFSPEPSQGNVRVLLDELRGKPWRLNDLLTGESFDRSGDQMRDSGLYIDLGPWKYHFWRLEKL